MKKILIVAILMCVGSAGCGLEIGHQAVNNSQKSKKKPSNAESKVGSKSKGAQKGQSVPAPQTAPTQQDLPAPIELSKILGTWEEVLADDVKVNDPSRKAWWFIAPRHVARMTTCEFDKKHYAMQTHSLFKRVEGSNLLKLARENVHSEASQAGDVICESHLSEGFMSFTFKDNNLVLVMGEDNEVIVLRRPAPVPQA